MVVVVDDDDYCCCPLLLVYCHHSSLTGFFISVFFSVYIYIYNMLLASLSECYCTFCMYSELFTKFPLHAHTYTCTHAQTPAPASIFDCIVVGFFCYCFIVFVFVSSQIVYLFVYSNKKKNNAKVSYSPLHLCVLCWDVCLCFDLTPTAILSPYILAFRLPCWKTHSVMNSTLMYANAAENVQISKSYKYYNSKY